MRASSLKLIGLLAIAAILGGGCFAAAVMKNEPMFALLGFATLLALLDCGRSCVGAARQTPTGQTGRNLFARQWKGNFSFLNNVWN